MKVAIVHDCLREYGGAERVVEALHEIWPDAPVYTSFVDRKGLGIHAEKFKNWDIRTSWVQHFPIIQRFISPLRFLMPFIWNSFDFIRYDVVITSSGWFISRGIVVHKPTIHVSYIHHPPRNLYGYATGSDLQKYWIVRAYATVINFFLRQYDFRAAQTVDYFIANSQETARRVWKFYRRESVVIYPPITVCDKAKNKHCPIVPLSHCYFLSVGRLTWAKRVDLVIKACNQLKLPLVVVGTGKEEKYLKSIAACPPSVATEGASGRSSTITFKGSVTDEELDVLYRNTKALIFSALDEDFGMVPVEAMAHGVPVIALAQGGVNETVIDKTTGVLFDKATVESLAGALKHFQKLSKSTSWASACRRQASKFSKTVFQNKLKAFIHNLLAS